MTKEAPFITSLYQRMECSGGCDSNLNHPHSRGEQEEILRRKCGCLRTSDKLKQILKSFPTPPPPSPSHTPPTPRPHSFQETCISSYCTHAHQPLMPAAAMPAAFAYNAPDKHAQVTEEVVKKVHDHSRAWGLVVELVQIVQLSVTATALALYYLIYCYMQLIYYALRSALFFHNADGPMKITIGVVTLTSIVVGFNLIIRMERLVGLLMF